MGTVLGSWLTTNQQSKILISSLLGHEQTISTIKEDKNSSSNKAYEMFFSIGLGTEAPLQNKFFTENKYKNVQTNTFGFCDLSQKVDVLIHSYGKRFETKYKYGNPFYLFSVSQSLKVMDQIQLCLIRKYPQNKKSVMKLMESAKQKYNQYGQLIIKKKSKIKKMITFTEKYDYLLNELGIESIYIPSEQINSHYTKEKTNLLSYQKSAYVLISKNEPALKKSIMKNKLFKDFQIIEIDSSIKAKSHLQYLKNLAGTLNI